MKRPNFFVMGAPKCGTTSVWSWLREHPNVYLPSVKEPHFFNSDHAHRGFTDKHAYEALFAEAGPQHYVVGEASVWYLYSKIAARNILKYTGGAKFIVCVRNPVDMAYSLYCQFLLRSRREHIKSFETAWHLSGERMRGRCVGPRVTEPKFLSYKAVCALGSQLAVLIALAGHEAVLPLVLDDLQESPASEYRKILRFLDIPDDERTTFPRLNEGLNVRSLAAHRLLHELRALPESIGFGNVCRGIGRQLMRLNTDERPRPAMPPHMREALTTHFESEIGMLFGILGKKYPSWLACE